MKKKMLGILLLVLGLIVENIGIFGIGRTGGQLKTIEGELQHEFFEEYTRAHEQSLMFGGGLITVGFILLIVGIVLVTSKRQTQREKETV